MRLLLWLARMVVSLAVGASPAWALDTGRCAPAPQVRAELAAAGMNPIIIGNRTGYGYPTALIFYATADGSSGALVRGDKPLGQQADTICVDSLYRDVRLNDISKPGIPSWAKMGGDAARADAICKRDRLGYQEDCSFHDAALTNLENNHQHVMLIATGTAINPRDKSIRIDQKVILTLNLEKRGGLINAVTPEGANYMLAAYTSGTYTHHATAMLK